MTDLSIASKKIAALSFRFALAVLLACSVLSLRAAAQTAEQIETVSIDTELVDLNVSVFSRDPLKTVGELQQKDFRIMENGEAEEITFFASASAPFDLVLLLDLSGSTADKIKLIRKSSKAFVEAARPTDRIAVVTFTDVPRLVSPLTSDRKELIRSIEKMEKPVGGTNFWDALHYVLRFVLGSTASRRSAVVAMTDGVDNALPDVTGDGSSINFEQLLDKVRSTDVIVLPIYLDTEQEMIKARRWPGVETSYAYARQQLQLLASESGGILYRARKVEDLRGVYEQVIRDLGTVYSIGYHPRNKRRDGSWRSVTVQLPGRPDLTPRAKRGYYAK